MFRFLDVAEDMAAKVKHNAAVDRATGTQCEEESAFCSGCGSQDDTEYMTLVNGDWYCCDCAVEHLNGHEQKKEFTADYINDNAAGYYRDWFATLPESDQTRIIMEAYFAMRTDELVLDNDHITAYERDYFDVENNDLFRDYMISRLNKEVKQ